MGKLLDLFFSHELLQSHLLVDESFLQHLVLAYRVGLFQAQFMYQLGLLLDHFSLAVSLGVRLEHVLYSFTGDILHILLRGILRTIVTFYLLHGIFIETLLLLSLVSFILKLLF